MFFGKVPNKDVDTALPINYATLAIIFNILGLGAMYSEQSTQKAVLVVLMLFLGNLLMFVGYFFILKKIRVWERKM